MTSADPSEWFVLTTSEDKNRYFESNDMLKGVRKRLFYDVGIGGLGRPLLVGFRGLIPGSTCQVKVK